jgi:hypothetical protein
MLRRGMRIRQQIVLHSVAIAETACIFGEQALKGAEFGSAPGPSTTGGATAVTLRQFFTSRIE